MWLREAMEARGRREREREPHETELKRESAMEALATFLVTGVTKKREPPASDFRIFSTWSANFPTKQN
jgi:hypothetical protein